MICVLSIVGVIGIVVSYSDVLFARWRQIRNYKRAETNGTLVTLDKIAQEFDEIYKRMPQ